MPYAIRACISRFSCIPNSDCSLDSYKKENEEEASEKTKTKKLHSHEIVKRNEREE